MNQEQISESVNFEATLEELNTLVEKMEAGDMTLEDSLKYFERGIILTRQCQTELKKAEQQVQILIESDKHDHLQPFVDEAVE